MIDIENASRTTAVLCCQLLDAVNSVAKNGDMSALLDLESALKEVGGFDDVIEQLVTPPNAVTVGPITAKSTAMAIVRLAWRVKFLAETVVVECKDVDEALVKDYVCACFEDVEFDSLREQLISELTSHIQIKALSGAEQFDRSLKSKVLAKHFKEYFKDEDLAEKLGVQGYALIKDFLLSADGSPRTGLKWRRRRDAIG